ncbi:MAG: NTP transferase domain-containing protein [Nanoarchaeota archaeon]|nr:NTP transferase domain-containing protein [Nanoarchaeota archaeon]MBU1135535.1 NTP transferase domain-containing protein [Nanoarchaeota archaeon]MBU2519751.1 NTP transferase domain-containing protein [Nanoarchaeota archaeon]
MKERVTLTLDKDLIEKIDNRVDGINIRNRSHAIELYLTRHFKEDRIKTAVVLCGGKGTRLRPITYEIPKVMMPVQGKMLIEHIFDLFKKHDINNIVLCVGYLKDKIKEQIGNGFKYGVNVTYVEEDDALGTAGPLKLMQQQGKLPTEPFIVSNGDELKDMDLNAMYEVHKKSSNLATIALAAVDNPSSYGVARLTGNKILEFIEKPENPPSNFINAGLYILDPKIIELIPDGHSMLEKDVFPKLAKDNNLFGFPFDGQWFDTGTPERYEKAIKEWKPLSG